MEDYSNVLNRFYRTRNPTEHVECPNAYSLGVDILPYLLDMHPKEIANGVKPSIIIAAMSLSTQQLHDKLTSATRKYRSSRKTDTFIRNPEALIFLNYEIGETYIVSLTVRNVTKAPQPLKVSFQTSRYFSLDFDNVHFSPTKIAPGMYNLYYISFRPVDLMKDYSHEIVFTYENSSFTVPIYGLGPRPVASMPDKITLPSTIVKVVSTRHVIFKNTGRSSLNYTKTVTEPFTSNFYKAEVLPGGILDVQYSCYSKTPGLITGESRTHVGDQIYVSVDLECEVKATSKVDLNTHMLFFNDINIGLCTRQILTLENNSDFKLNFAWKNYNAQDEQDDMLRLVDLLIEMKNYEQQRYEKLKYLDILDGPGHAEIYERIFLEEKNDLLKNENFLFNSECYKIIPRVGKVLPRSSFDFYVIFAPKKNKDYNESAYLDIEGSEKRHKVSLKGCGLGPPVVLTIKSVDVGNIYLTDKHEYELAVINKGVVPATVLYRPKPTDFGGTITVVPHSLEVPADSTRGFLVAFCSDIQGGFVETVDFMVEESDEPLQFVLSGNVFCPKLTFIPESLDFGVISVGTTTTKEIVLSNDSRVSISFDMELEDSHEPSNEYLSVIPNYGQVRPRSRVVVKVIVEPQQTKDCTINLLLIIWKSKMYTSKIPITFTSSVPEILCDPAIVCIKFCFLNCVYVRKVSLINKSELPGEIEYIPADKLERATCILDQTRFSFEPHQTHFMELQLSVTELGMAELPLRFSIIGKGIETLCTVKCFGQGPVVSYNPDKVDFGTVQVLDECKQTVTLSNDSPIPALIKMLCKKTSRFFIAAEQTEITLNPEEQQPIEVGVMLNNPGKFTDTILFNIFQGDSSAIQVSAFGEGTSLLTEPSLKQGLDLGTVLTYTNNVKDVKITNKGDEVHCILITKNATVKNLRCDPEVINSAVKITPTYAQLQHDESVTIHIRYTSKSPRVVAENLYCQAMVGKNAHPITLLSFPIKVTFVDPTVDFSKTALKFHLSFSMGKTEGKVEDEITVDNKTGLPLNMSVKIVNCEEAFTIVDGNRKSNFLEVRVDNKTGVLVNFSPIIKARRKVSRQAALVFAYGNHPKTDMIPLHGNVIFPTIKLIPEVVDFACVPPGSTNFANIILHNISSVGVHFRWIWQEDSEKMEILSPTDDVNITFKTYKDSQPDFFMDYVDAPYNSSSRVSFDKLKREPDTSGTTLSSDEPYDRATCLSKMKKVLVNLLVPFASKLEEPLVLRPHQDLIGRRNIQDVFTIEPSQGYLGPRQYTIITFGFTPHPNTNIEACAICEVQGGEEQYVLLNGKSSRISYQLSSYLVDFGNQLFCETSRQEVVLTNTGLCGFDFSLTMDPWYGAELLSVNPASGYLQPEKEITVEITYFPAVPGVFERTLTLVVGYLTPTTVQVKGYAVPVQINVPVPRRKMLEHCTEYYKAIASITTDFMANLGYKYPEVDDRLDDPGNYLSDRNWEVISVNDLFPTTIDIRMAVERKFLKKLIINNPDLLENHISDKKLACIPDFHPPSYFVDFGYVVRDIPVCYTLLLTNYGPKTATMKLLDVDPLSLSEHEIKIFFTPGTLQCGEYLELYVVFSPTARRFTELNEVVQVDFQLAVKHGAVIRVDVRAEVTLPYLSLMHDELQFEHVFCGNVMRKSIGLTNVGNVPGKFSVRISKPTIKGTAHAFFVIPQSGQLDVGQSMFLHVYFMPEDYHEIRRTLTIDIESNPTPVTLKLVGYGLHARLTVMPEELRFAPTLNYFEKTMCFAVQNMCAVPLEFVFPGFDRLHERDKVLIDMYLKYKNINQMLVPLRRAGDLLPQLFEETHNFLVNKLRSKLLLDKVDKDTDLMSTEEDPLSRYSSKELDRLLMEYIEADGFDNTISSNYELEMQNKIEIVEPPCSECADEVRKAMVLVFHGPQETDYQQAANDAGIALKAPVYSIDQLIIEALVEDVDPIADEIRGIIEDAFVNRIQEEIDDKIRVSEYDKMYDKINTILTMKPSKKKGSTKSVDKKSRDSKSQESRKSVKTADGCLLGLPLDFLVDLLRAKLKNLPFLVVDSLYSVFIPKENLALYSLLRAVGSVDYIHFVILSMTINDMVRNEERRLQDLKNKEKGGKSGKPQTAGSEKSKKSSKKSDMDSGAGSKASNLKKNVLKNIGKQMQKSLEKFELLRQEIMHVAHNWDRRKGVLKKPYIPGKRDSITSKNVKNLKGNGKKPDEDSHYESDQIILWIVANSGNSRNIDFPAIVSSAIIDEPTITTVIDEVNQSLNPKLVEFQTEFTIISKPINAGNTDLPDFVISDFREAPPPTKVRSKSSSLILKPTKKGSKSSRKSLSSSTSVVTQVSEMSDPVSVKKLKLPFTTNRVLLPGDLITYQVTFCPTKVGLYRTRYTIEDKQYHHLYYVDMSAKCEVPHLDLNPTSMFPRMVQSYIEKASYDHFIYIQDQNIFDFGSIIAGPTMDKSPLYSANIVLRNSSSSVCEVQAYLENEVFTIDEKSLFIEPKRQDVLTVLLRCNKVGRFASKLFLSIRNNPEVFTYFLVCFPCKLEFGVEPKSIVFDKVPINYTAHKIVTMTNSSPIDLRWELSDSNWVTEIFQIKETNGVVNMYSVKELDFKFTMDEERFYPKKIFSIMVQDKNSISTEPFHVETLTISAESVEHKLVMDRSIDLGHFKGGVDTRIDFPISNKGNADVTFKIQTIDNPLESWNYVRDFIRIQSRVITLASQRSEKIRLNIFPKRTFSVEKLLIFVVSILEAAHSGQVVENFEIVFTGTAHMPSYTVCPQQRLSFGCVAVNTMKKGIIELVNTGRFNFNFSVLNYAKVLEKSFPKKKSDVGQKGMKSGKSSGSDKKSKNKSEMNSENTDKRSKSKNSKDTRKSETTKVPSKIDVGPFTITPSAGHVEAGKKLEIEVYFTLNDIEHYKERILIDVAEIQALDQKKVIKIEATGCEPKINFMDFESIFIEQYLTGNIDGFLAPKNVDGYSVFDTSTTTLHFKSICIGTSHKTNLNFKNIGFVSGIVTSKLDSNIGVFTINHPTQNVAANSAGTVEVTFIPTKLQRITANLEISYNAASNNKMLIHLLGEACLPQIKILHPEPVDNEFVISFNYVCVGDVTIGRVAFQNVGQIACSVIVEVGDEVLSLAPCEGTLRMLTTQVPSEVHDMKRNMRVSLLQDEIAVFKVIYVPTTDGFLSTYLNLYTLRNPYDEHKVLLSAISYDNDVVIEGLHPTACAITKRSQILRQPVAYLLDLGFKVMNRLHKTSFVIRNRTCSEVYKFKFYSNFVSFIPETGHLRPRACKEVLVIFKATSPVVYDMEEIQCTLVKIIYPKDDHSVLSWDDRQKFVLFMENSDLSLDTYQGSVAGVSSDSSTKKPIMEGMEPHFVTESDSLTKFSIYLKAVSDYCRYECDVKAISFPDTYLNESSVQQFNIHNIGNVPINITWTIVDPSNTNPLRKTASNENIYSKINVHGFNPAAAPRSSSTSTLSTTWNEEKTIDPLTIVPVKTTIDAGQTGNFVVTFSPVEENDVQRRLVSEIEQLDCSLEQPGFDVVATALPLPIYFETEDGGYVNRDVVVEFEAIGVSSDIKRKLLLVNPSSDQQLTFQIYPDSNTKKEFSYFFCNTIKGTIKPKRKLAAVFLFQPAVTGSFEETHILSIPDKKVVRNIFLKAICREPKVYFKEPNITLKATVPKVKVTKVVKMVNEEMFNVSFKFVKRSLMSECQLESVQVFPMMGKLKPHSDVDIKLTFATANVATCHFHLRCLVEKVKIPLSLTITSKCVNVEPNVIYQDRTKGTLALQPTGVNVVDLGFIQKGYQLEVPFTIANKGPTGMFYSWDMDAKCISHLFRIRVSPDKEFIKSGLKAEAKLFIDSIRSGTLKLFKINLKIMYGPTYRIHLNALSESPAYLFSFTTHNFGHCFTQHGETDYYKTLLTFRNQDAKPVFLTCLTEENDHLKVTFQPSHLKPGHSIDIPINFFPQQPGTYKDEVTFSAGGALNKIQFIGEAANVKLELCNLKDKFIDFGSVLVSTVKKHRVWVVNGTQVKMEVHFGVFDCLLVHTRKRRELEKEMKLPVLPPPPVTIDKKKKGKDIEEKKEDKPKTRPEKKTKQSVKQNNKKQQIEEEALTSEEIIAEQREKEQRQEYLKSIEIIPNNFIDIPAKGKAFFDIIFKPFKRVELTEMIYFETQDFIKPICNVKGISLMAEFSLDKKELNFRDVIVGCPGSQNVHIKNTGDVTGSFIWKLDDKHPAFSVEPLTGFVLPNKDFNIKITYLAKTNQCDTKSKIKCTIKETQQTFDLILRANSVQLPQPTETISMTCPVRSTFTAVVPINNTTSEQLSLNIDISPGVFTTKRLLVAAPFTNTPITVTYAPIRMTSTPDKGSMLVKYPDGTGQLYCLIGTADPPIAEKRIEREIHAKQNYYEFLTVDNWLETTQTFKMRTELASPLTEKTLFKTFGIRTIQLDGSERYKYKWGIYVVNEGYLEVRVFFTNPRTKEYRVFEVSLRVLSAGPVDTVRFDGRVREVCTRFIELENPIDQEVCFNLEMLERLNVKFPRMVVMDAYTTMKVDILWTPLLAGQFKGTITAVCDQLGTYAYNLNLKAAPPFHEQSVGLVAEIGESTTKDIIFKNILDKAVDFTYTIDNGDFFMAKCLPIAAKDTSTITVGFEPSTMTTTSATLRLVSTIAGEYIYPLQGDVKPPSAKGPFKFAPRTSLSIDFRNPFKQRKLFNFFLDSDAFYSDLSEQEIDSEQVATCQIWARSSEGDFDVITGKLIVFTPDLPQVQWKYYLELADVV